MAMHPQGWTLDFSPPLNTRKNAKLASITGQIFLNADNTLTIFYSTADYHYSKTPNTGFLMGP